MTASRESKPAADNAPGPSPRATRSLLIWPFLGAIYTYRILLGPWLGGHCRFHPTCSQYGLDAYRTHGPLRGSWLTLRRLARCHPFGGRGFDPVPEPPNIESPKREGVQERQVS